MTEPEIPPIRRSILVSWDPETAFRKFTAEFASWWPTKTHSIGGEKLNQVIFEQHLGGRIFEEHQDGRRFQWGEILEWQPPLRLSFSWHPSRDSSTAQHVEIEFVRVAEGTRLQLTSTGWEKWGKGARRARRGYDLGWKYVLNVWAGRRTAGMAVVDAIDSLMVLAERLRGGREAMIARSQGEITSVSKGS
jgi:uncharacterized protein YndB with AHSA1/START domain